MKEFKTLGPTQFGVGDGAKTRFSVARPGDIVRDSNIESVSRVGWQGNQLLYPYPRTNLAIASNDFTNSAWQGSPSIYMDFLSGIMPSSVYFSRASTATYIGRDRLIHTAAINEPRFTYDPVTGEALGLLVEGQATNFVEFSESTFVYPSSAIVVYNYSSSPSGMTDATLIYGDSANVYARPQGQQTLMSGQDYVASVFCKPMGINSSRAAVWLPGSVFNDSASGNGPQCRINPDGSIVTWGDPDRYGVDELADGWYRVWVSHRAIHTAIPSNLMRFWPVFARSNPEDGWLFWGMQMEEGTHPTSYIPTEGSQVTRAGDHNMVSIPSQNSNRGGSLCIDLTSFVFGNYSAALFANNPFEGYLLLCATHISPEGIDYGISLAALTGITFFPLSGLEENKRHKLSVGWSGRSFVAFLDGVKVADEIDVGFDIPSFNELNLFSNSDVGLTSGAAGIVNKVAYYPKRLTDAQLAALTEL